MESSAIDDYGVDALGRIPGSDLHAGGREGLAGELSKGPLEVDGGEMQILLPQLGVFRDSCKVQPIHCQDAVEEPLGFRIRTQPAEAFGIGRFRRCISRQSGGVLVFLRRR